MKIHLLKIQKLCKSKIIVIPQILLKMVENENEKIIIEIAGNNILLKNKNFLPIQGWRNAFKKMSKNNDDKLLLPDVFADK